MLVLKYVVTIHIQKQYLRVRWAWTEFCSLFVFTTFFIKHNRSRNSDKARGFMCFVIRYWSPWLWSPTMGFKAPQDLPECNAQCPVCHLENRKKMAAHHEGHISALLCFWIFPLVMHLYHLSHEIHDSKSHPWSSFRDKPSLTLTPPCILEVTG